jgi:crossover junction endodeoxyribonuclease RuvC
VLILGLDPGSRHTGYGLVEVAGDTLRAASFGRLSSSAAQPVPQRLASLSDQLENLLDRWQPQIAVLETPFHGLNTRTLVVLAQARGALLAVLAGRGLEIAEYSPAEVKSAVSGDGRADKQQVARMVRLHLRLAEASLSADAADALAVALCWAFRRRMDRILSAGDQP